MSDLPPCEVCGKVTHGFDERPTAAEVIQQLVEALERAAGDFHYLMPEHTGPLDKCWGTRCELNYAALAAARTWLAEHPEEEE